MLHRTPGSSTLRNAIDLMVCLLDGWPHGGPAGSRRLSTRTRRRGGQTTTPVSAAMCWSSTPLGHRHGLCCLLDAPPADGYVAVPARDPKVQSQGTLRVVALLHAFGDEFGARLRVVRWGLLHIVVVDVFPAPKRRRQGGDEAGGD